MKIGYARVSTTEQNLDLQESALRNDGVTHIFTDKGISGATQDRPGLNEALHTLQRDDVLVVWKVDRLGRSVAHLAVLLDKFGKDGIGFKSLTEGIDTTTLMGRAIYQISAVFAELERGHISERTRAGMDAARRAGKNMGRPIKLTRQQVVHARDQIAAGQSKGYIAGLLAVNIKTLNLALGRLPKA